VTWLVTSTRTADDRSATSTAASAAGAQPPRTANARPLGVPQRAAPGEAAAAWDPTNGPGPRHGNRPERDRRWRERMNRIDREARAALGLNDATAQRLDALQLRLRQLKQDVRDRFGSNGLSREQVVARIQQRTGGFRAQVVEILGDRDAKIYLRIVEDGRSGSSATATAGSASPTD
jgi:hypothetical protein